jgi:hypothetical protein
VKNQKKIQRPGSENLFGTAQLLRKGQEAKPGKKESGICCRSKRSATVVFSTGYKNKLPLRPVLVERICRRLLPGIALPAKPLLIIHSQKAHNLLFVSSNHFLVTAICV